MIELRVLGPTSLRRSDGSSVQALLAQPKRLALATYLATPPPHGGRCFYQKDTLLAMFWPELDQPHARAALRNALYFLRTHLGAAAVVTRSGDVVGLDPAEVWCDVDAFDVAVRLRDHATAYQLYRGALLEGVFVPDAQPFEEWLDTQRRWCSNEAREAASQAARRHAAAGWVDDALEWARRARELAPLNEDAARLVMALRYLTGDRAGALDEYKRLETSLDAEHGVLPAADTQRLARAVRDPHAHAESVAKAVAQLPVTARISPQRGASAAGAARVQGRPVLEALLQTRLGLARRRGERVGVVLVALPDGAAPADGSGSQLTLLGDCVLGGIRMADLVAEWDARTLAVVPSSDAAVDVNALVGRLARYLERVAAADFGVAPGPDCIRTLWLNPTWGRTVRELLLAGQSHP